MGGGGRGVEGDERGVAREVEGDGRGGMEVGAVRGDGLEEKEEGDGVGGGWEQHSVCMGILQ